MLLHAWSQNLHECCEISLPPVTQLEPLPAPETHQPRCGSSPRFRAHHKSAQSQRTKYLNRSEWSNLRATEFRGFQTHGKGCHSARLSRCVNTTARRSFYHRVVKTRTSWNQYDAALRRLVLWEESRNVIPFSRETPRQFYRVLITAYRPQ